MRSFLIYSCFFFILIFCYFKLDQSRAAMEGKQTLDSFSLKGSVEKSNDPLKKEEFSQIQMDEDAHTEAKGLFELNSFSHELNAKTKEEISSYVRKILKTNEYDQPKKKRKKEKKSHLKKVK